MINKYQMSSSDITFKFKTEEYQKLISFFEKNEVSNTKAQFLLALMGYDAEKKINLKENDGSNERTISRVVYQHSSNEFDSYFGLLTILDNLDKPYKQVINKKAFLKNTKGEKYTELINVSTFYEYLLGGIDSCYNVLSIYDDKIDNEKEVFDALYEYLFMEEHKNLLEDVANNFLIKK